MTLLGKLRLHERWLIPLILFRYGGFDHRRHEKAIRLIMLRPELTSREPGRALVLTPDDFENPEMGAAWDLLIPIEYDRYLLLQGLTNWLGSPDGLRILDCACGSGFPALDLHFLGYDIVCTDASSLMLERFSRNAKSAGMSLSPSKVYWEELGARYTKQFDVVLCRGCSLIYAGTWESKASPDRNVLQRTIDNFTQCLRPGGRLYIDVTKRDDLCVEDTYWIKRVPRIVDGHRVEVEERVIADRSANARHWFINLSIDEKLFKFERISHYITYEQLEDFLSKAGFKHVAPIGISGERYTVFTGQLPPD